MRVIADTDEPPAKCCRYCEESTHNGVDGPVSWRLTLDQDLIDTLKRSFPNWFQVSSPDDNHLTTALSSSISSPSSHASVNNGLNDNRSATPITVYETHHNQQHRNYKIGTKILKKDIIKKNNSKNLQSQLNVSSVNSFISLSTSPTSSITSNCSGASSKKSCSSSNSSRSSSSSSTSRASRISSKISVSLVDSAISNLSKNHLNNGHKAIGVTTAATTVTFAAETAVTDAVLTLGKKTSTKSIKSYEKQGKTISKSASLHSFGSSDTISLLATFSSPDLVTTIDTNSDSSCNALLSPTNLSGKHYKHSFKDIIFMQDTYENMSEGEQHLNGSSLLGGSSDDGTNSDFYDPRQSPPKAIVDSSPLQPAMDKNKESLKVKLMVRRPHSQLVEQGIIPPLKTSPAIHEQCKQLERAKTSDLLKAKIQQRPNREDLERRHILEEDECHIDPSLAEKQRMLKKARLADQLNSQIQHRPGPLELIKKNILHTEKPIEKIVKEGLVSFKATSEGLLTRPQHPNSYVTFEDDSQSSESDTRQTPPRVDTACGINDGGGIGCEALQAAVTSADIVTVALTIPTSGGPVVVTSAPVFQSKLPLSKIPYIPPPPPPPLPPVSGITGGVCVKQETANLFEELCQSVAGAPGSPGNNIMTVVSSPSSMISTSSMLSPLSSVASPPQSLTSRTSILCGQQLHISKSDAPGKDKNRKKTKSKPVSKARTIKFHEYKGPPNAAQKLNNENTAPEETSYQLMLEQQNCLLKFLETLNKNQSIIPATVINAAGNSVINSCNVSSAVTTVAKSNAALTTVSTATEISSPAMSQLTNTVAKTGTTDVMNNIGSTTNSTFPMITSLPPPSPTLSINSSIPPSPATSHAESTGSITDHTRLEKMKVSDLKIHLKRRNLPVSGPKPQLIERLKPYLPLDAIECSSSMTTPVNVTSSDVINMPSSDAMDATTITVPENPITMIVNSPHSTKMSPERSNIENEQMDVVQLNNSSHSVLSPQPQSATIILSNEELVREQQRKIYELQRQLQRSQQELEQIRQKQQQQQKSQHHPHQQTVTAQVVNALPTQQITLITTTTATPQTLTVLPQIKDSVSLPTKLSIKSQANYGKSNSSTTHKSSGIATAPVTPQAMSQKMVVKQQLEAKIQKQKQAAAAAAAAAAQIQVHTEQQAQVQAQAIAQSQAQTQLRRLSTQKIQTVLIPTTTAALTSKKLEDTIPLTHPPNCNTITTTTSNCKTTSTTTTLLANQLPLATKTHNNLGLVWNEGNQTIFLVGLNDQHMTAHTIGNFSLTNASPVARKIINGHQRTNSLPSILFPVSAPVSHEQQLIETKPIISPQQLHQLQMQQQFLDQTFQPGQQIIQLDVKPKNLTPAPLPPQYEEATKHMTAKNNLLNIKVKEEPNTNSMTTQTQSKRKNAKTEKIRDVLHALVKQSEVPANALESVVSVAPFTASSGNNPLITNASENIIFSLKAKGTMATAATHVNPTETPVPLVPKQEPPNGILIEDTLVAQPMDVTPTGPQTYLHQEQQKHNEENINTVFQILSSNEPPTAMSSINNTFIESIDMASPLQPDENIDAESVAKSLDIFLDQHHSAQSTASGITSQRHQQSPTHHDMLSKTSAPLEKTFSTPVTKLNHFDEFELLELMSQQLEMDIGDDTGNFTPQVSNGSGSIDDACLGNNGNASHSLHHSNNADNKNDNATVNSLNGLRRDMNPSLQPSISELIQQQLEQQHQQLKVVNNNNNCIGNHSHHSDMVTSNTVEIDFDAASFVAQLSQNNLDCTTENSNQHHQNRSNGSNNNNSNNNTNTNCASNIARNSHDENHFGATPMDVCDDFDNPLGSFGFSEFSSDSNINTPPHPFSGSGLNSGCSDASSIMNSIEGTRASTSPTSERQINISGGGTSGGEKMSVCNITTDMGNSLGVDNVDVVSSFDVGDDIFDFFNIDDYKMSWGEGDFAV